MAYAWSSGVGVLVWGILGSAAVAFGPNRFSLRFDGIRKGMVGELFSYSSAVFVIAIAIQVLLMGQTLVAIKILGITAGAVYAVTSRAPIMAMQLVWQPFDAFAPRWQQAFCSGATNKIRQEFSMMARISLLFATFAFVALILVNPPFVRWWTKPEYFGGQTLNVLLAVYLLFQTGTHCFAYAFTLHKQMRLWTAIEIIAVLLCLAGMIAAVPRLGLAGIPAALIAVNVAGGFWFVVAKGGRLMGVRAGQIARKDAIFVISTLALGASFAIWDPLRGRTGGVVMFLSACTLAVTASIPVLLRIFLLLKAMSTQRALPQEAMDAPAPTLS
jgi:O-antigen/teichoic acid export membrane protein